VKVINTGGKIYYGMHFYPGVAEYAEPNQQPFRICINEDTIRSMNPSFAGKPIYVEHVNEVPDKVDEIKEEADGWVIESFFNQADGKTWVKFIVVSEKGERAIANGFRLSNAYIPRLQTKEGLWNGVSYQQEVVGGEYEHLAIVKTPRYDESVIMTPEEFKSYNTNKETELKRLANSTIKKETTRMKALSFFKKSKVENATDFESMSVTLPKSGKEKTLIQLVNEADESEEKKAKNEADPAQMVKLHDGTMCNVGELLEKHKALHDAHEALKSEMKPESEGDLAPEETPVDVAGDMHNEEDADDDKDKDKEVPEKKKNSKDVEAAKKKENFETLKNAHLTPPAKVEEVVVDFSDDQVKRGQKRYGSGR
jgi:hypothetical protein